MSPLRYLSRFEKADGSASVTFPTHLYEWESTQPLLQSSVQLVGANYGYDQMEGAPPLKANGIERVRFLDVGQPANVDDDFDDIKAMMLWGRGKVWTTGASGNRWAWARLTEMPTISFTVENVAHFPILLLFERFSDWYDEEPIGYEGEFVLSSDPQTIGVVNPGNAVVRSAVITVVGPFSGLVITNNTTGQVLETDRVADYPTDVIRFDAGRNVVEFSDDGGATWIDDWENFVRADGQVSLMDFNPGSNSLTIDGANGADVIVEFSGAWH